MRIRVWGTGYGHGIQTWSSKNRVLEETKTTLRKACSDEDLLDRMECGEPESGRTAVHRSPCKS